MEKALFAFTVLVLCSVTSALSTFIIADVTPSSPFAAEVVALHFPMYQNFTNTLLMSMVQRGHKFQPQYHQHQRQYQYQHQHQLQRLNKKTDNPDVAATRKGFVESLPPNMSASKGLTEELTSKIEGMFTDIITSQDTILDFYAAAGAEIADGLTVQVLNTGSWPAQSVATCTLPPEILRVYNKFKTYYLGTQMDRRLLWHTNVGNTDMKAKSGKGKQTSRQRPKHLRGLLAYSRVFQVLVGRGISSALQIVPL